MSTSLLAEAATASVAKHGRSSRALLARASTWKFATNDGGEEPDVVLACAGDVPTIEICATSWLLQKYVPGIKVRVVNVVDLTVLMSPMIIRMAWTTCPSTLYSPKTHLSSSPFTIIAGSFTRWFTGALMKAASMCAAIWIRARPLRRSICSAEQDEPFSSCYRCLKYVSRLRSEASDIVDTFNRKLYEHTTTFGNTGRHAGDHELALDS